MTKIVNLFAGPGAGKSTLASGLFYQLKTKAFNVELVTEYAKDCTWESRHITLANQPYLFGKQHNRLHRLFGKVDLIINDSPLLLCCHYSGDRYPPSFKTFIVDFVNTMDNENYFLERKKRYSEVGRNQTEEEAKAIDASIKKLLDETNTPYTCVQGTEAGLQFVTEDVIRRCL